MTEVAKPVPISRADLRKLARARLKDAQCLYAGKRYDGAVYLCGYVIELALKARICRTLKWPSFDVLGPAGALRTHGFDLLLSFSGIEARVKTLYWNQWSTVGTWEAELRYKPVGSATQQQARELIDAATELLGVL